MGEHEGGVLMFGRKCMIEFKVQTVIERDEEGFHAFCPALQGLHTYGNTAEEALQNVKDAATAYLQSCIKHRDPIPVGVLAEQRIEAPNGRWFHQAQELAVACAT